MPCYVMFVAAPAQEGQRSYECIRHLEMQLEVGMLWWHDFNWRIYGKFAGWHLQRRGVPGRGMELHGHARFMPGSP